MRLEHLARYLTLASSALLLSVILCIGGNEVPVQMAYMLAMDTINPLKKMQKCARLRKEIKAGYLRRIQTETSVHGNGREGLI